MARKNKTNKKGWFTLILSFLGIRALIKKFKLDE